jgi:RNA polymerase sigma-70 factor (ECF subfamily)
LHVLKFQKRLVRKAIEKLPLEFREVIILRDLEELSYKEIAVVTGIPIGTVMSRLARARNKLQSCLRGPCRESKVKGIKEAAQRY